MQSRRRGVRRGAAAVEMAAIMPVFLMMVIGMIEMSRLGMATQLVTTAAREGCRVAVIAGSTQSDVQTRINAVLSGSGIAPGTVTPSPATWSSSTGGTAITVSISVPFSQVAWITPIYLKTTTITASATMSSERP